MNATVLPAANSQQTKIYLGYTVVMGDAHHAFVIAEDPSTGDKYMTRAGPSAQGSSQSSGASGSSASGGSLSASSGDGDAGGFGWGTIRAQSAKWHDEIAFDRPSDTVARQYVGTIDKPHSEVVRNMIEFSNVTNGNEIPYSPLGPNSNSYAFTFIESLGLKRPAPSFLAPGHDMGTPDNGLSYEA
uniref:Uncharacterized protein n=1 Tax=Candidatus Kentrum sp. LFY TaxID=2126342 RepID=A0A450WMR3_9GAMM|nr:MAG: hypothetical protein BECKLFY1418C_GA0070996_10416 [Candidatus Kentron sp. LFY]